MTRLLCTWVGIGCVLAVLSGCVARAPAPIVDRRPAPAKPASAASDTYVVKRGDTLYSIALDQGLDWRELAAINQLQDPAKLSTGQVLRLKPVPSAAAPAVEESPVVVNPIAIGPEIEARPLGSDAPLAPGVLPPPSATPSAVLPTATAPGGIKTEPKGMRLPYSDQNFALLQRGEKILPAAPPRVDAPIVATKPEVPPPAAKPELPPAVPPPVALAPAVPPPDAEAGEDRVDWGWPASGKVLATFDGSNSKGVDISGRIGDPIYASASGRVVYSGEGIPAYGKLVIIRHNNTYLSAYAHNNQILVREGQSVARGQKIAELGATGATQAKLHFEIRRMGKPVDPMQYLPHRAN